MKAEIKNITIITQPGVKQYCIGESDVARIEDNSLEYEDHIHSLYYGYDVNGKQLFKIENCPVVIEYK